MPRQLSRPQKSITASPFLRCVYSQPEAFSLCGYPKAIPAFRHGIHLQFTTPVTFFVGENGAGKSTLLEAMAECCGYPPEGGNRDHLRESMEDRSPLARALRVGWFPRTSDGFFLRAESFYNFASYLDEVSTLRAYGGKSLHRQSHGESFLALFENRFEQGVFLLDEPEAALSPQRQLTFLRIIHALAEPKQAQFIIATHSPILLAYPGATIYHFDEGGIHRVDYRETEHYQLMRDFLNAPERFFRHLFSELDLGDEA